MFTFSIVVMYMGVPYFGGGLCPLHKLCFLLTSMYVTYLRLFVVVSKCKTFTYNYMQCVCNKYVHRSTLQCLFPLGHAPFT